MSNDKNAMECAKIIRGEQTEFEEGDIVEAFGYSEKLLFCHGEKFRVEKLHPYVAGCTNLDTFHSHRFHPKQLKLIKRKKVPFKWSGECKIVSSYSGSLLRYGCPLVSLPIECIGKLCHVTITEKIEGEIDEQAGK